MCVLEKNSFAYTANLARNMIVHRNVERVKERNKLYTHRAAQGVSGTVRNNLALIGIISLSFFLCYFHAVRMMCFRYSITHTHRFFDAPSTVAATAVDVALPKMLIVDKLPFSKTVHLGIMKLNDVK